LRDFRGNVSPEAAGRRSRRRAGKRLAADRQSGSLLP